MAVAIQPLGSPGNLPDLLTKLRAILQDLEDQLNAEASVLVTNSIPRTGEGGSVYINPYNEIFQLAVSVNKTQRFLNPDTIGALNSVGTNFLGIVESGGFTPTLTDFPNDKDWGFFFNGFSAMSLVINREGTLYTI